MHSSVRLSNESNQIRSGPHHGSLEKRLKVRLCVGLEVGRRCRVSSINHKEPIHKDSWGPPGSLCLGSVWTDCRWGQDWFQDEEKEFELSPWSPKGADINHIENIWAEMVRHMEFHHTANANELWGSVYDTWNQLSRRQIYWQSLINLMVNRLALIIEVDGNWTKC